MVLAAASMWSYFCADTRWRPPCLRFKPRYRVQASLGLSWSVRSPQSAQNHQIQAEYKVDPTGGAATNAKKKRRNVPAEKSVENEEQLKQAIWNAMISRQKNKKAGWGEFSSNLLKSPCIPDDRDREAGNNLTPTEFIIWKFSASHRKNFKNFTLRDEQWDELTKHLKTAREKTADEIKDKVRDSIAEIIGSDTVEKSCTKAVEFGWRHAECLTENKDLIKDGAGLSAPPLPGAQQQLPASSSAAASSGAGGDNNIAPKAAAPAAAAGSSLLANVAQPSLVLPSQSGSAFGSQSEVDVDELTPRTRQMFLQSSAAMEIDSNPMLAGVPETISFAELSMPLTSLELGDYDTKVSLLGVFAKIAPESSSEAIRCLCAVVKAGKGISFRSKVAVLSR